MRPDPFDSGSAPRGPFGLLHRLGFVAGAVGLVAVMGLLYAHAADAGRWPASHPWSALACGAAAGNLLLHAARPDDLAPDSPRFAVAGGLLVVSLLPMLALGFA